MWSRKRLDIGWCDLAFAGSGCLWPRLGLGLAADIERCWSPADAMVCLSVRSAFDLLFSALELPPRSEVLVSAVTISGMLRILQQHGLVAVPVDLEISRMAPCLEALSQGLSPRTRAVLVAHLFGGRIDLQPLADFAHRHGLLLIEDAAQAYSGPGYTGHSAADISMFSFGPIKTATALGGALVRVRDRQLLNRMRRIQSTWPVQRRRDFFLRVTKYAGLKAASSRPAYSTIVSLCQAVGHDHDRLVNGSVRGFADGAFFSAIRRQPSPALLSLIQRRLAQFDQHQITERVGHAERIMGDLRGTACFPGSACTPHVHWLLPMAAAEPLRLIEILSRSGFDATQGQSLVAVAPPADRPELAPLAAQQVLSKILFLPCYAEMSPAAVDRLARLVARETSHPLRLQPAT